MTNEEELRYVAESIRRIRQAKKISQLELSTKANLSQSFLANIEKFKKEPSAMPLIRIARALECSPRDFFPESTFGSIVDDRSAIKKEIANLLERL